MCVLISTCMILQKTIMKLGGRLNIMQAPKRELIFCGKKKKHFTF